jgi:hypothetical protein
MKLVGKKAKASTIRVNTINMIDIDIDGHFTLKSTIQERSKLEQIAMTQHDSCNLRGIQSA